MYVLAGTLAAADLAVVTDACAELGLAVHHDDHEVADDVMLCALHRTGGEAVEPSPAEVRRRGGYPIAVLDSVSATGVLGALTEGYAFALATPLRRPRVVAALGYLKSVAPPEPAQRLTLAPGLLRSPSRQTPVTAAEAGLLRALANKPGQIVSRTELAGAAGDEDVNAVVSVLRRKLADIDSGAKILKVPHLGFRLVGTVEDTR
ncbi:helix-turn-helix domain-containing protein [Crossiella sp. CA-258035]|uniref:winged helix-turn-helix domain-containing protein n=1 Tax=Crossiella sp. CA-258035 TaxID=2981138 RepID=UPI0024BD09A4|nr:helix-turn-helix domain-containing protein [Crossiella sp. CA-258035]WHT23236.1 helix-turn-helix domain-containing protein [Crossiella sp. CA-258035]